MTSPRRLLAAPDKFRGSLSAPDVARAMAEGARSAGWEAVELPLGDGGEGALEGLGGPNMTTVVTGPLGRPVAAEWRLHEGLAVVEMARASGLALAGGPEANDPWSATTRGTGELVAAAIAAGAREVIVCAGGSATTDGGLGAVEALGGVPFAERGVSVSVACDVRTVFVDAASVFAPQKGAGPEMVDRLADRLAALQDQYKARYGIDLSRVPGSGAAGGLAGGLAALGAALTPGFELIAAAQGLDRALRDVGAVASGEGRLDQTSFEGKVVGAVAERARQAGLPFLAVAGSVAPAAEGRVPAVSLAGVYGEEQAWARPAELVSLATQRWLSSLG